MEIIQQFYRDTSGATMVEYALMVAFIALVAMGGAGVLGASVNSKFNEVSGGFGS
jgi:pilus assembly protein Flp/PilA